ncbi:DNA primase [Paenibacillus thermoaerophilus]|uniref:DNA primase n=1 Tax=Paenibacillus thermoaerophilus TaxID=1215385 RepID=A0ABW2UXJ6_9BACL|nr:DNA primase [Paenibacillus thermoaerophilus]TMV19037.1 DNA primase [Paenibacillus thermoaerophilus]
MNHGRIPDEIIDAVLRAHDVAEVVGRYVRLSKHGKNLKGLCPFHSEKSPSFNVNPELQVFKCFGCGAGGNVITFLRDIEGLTFVEAVRRLAEEAKIDTGGIGDANDEPPEKRARDQALLDGHEFACKLYEHLLKHTEEGRKALDYLLSRGLRSEMIDTFRIGYAPNRRDVLTRQLERRGFDLELMEQGGLLSRSEKSGFMDKFRDRITFPIHDAKGRIVAFAGRAMGDAQPKYLNSPESPIFNKSRTLYNLHQARPAIRKENTVVLFEGYADVIQAWDSGERRGVATMGTSLTDEHARQLRRMAENVIICYDGDDAGQAAAYKALQLLEPLGCSVRVAMIPDRLDPDEYIRRHGADAFRGEIVEAAVPAVKYRLIYLRKNFRLQEEDGRLRYLRQAAGIIARLDSATEREYYIRELSDEFRISAEAFRQDVNETRISRQKVRDDTDIAVKSWHTGRNDGRPAPQETTLKPAYWNAERQLLALMMHDAEVAHYVREALGEEFNEPEHAALAAYLYAYYAGGREPNPIGYMATLQDGKLESLAAAISMIGSEHGTHPQVIDDYIRVIREPLLMRQLEQKKEEMVRAERAGDAITAARILSEIIPLERSLNRAVR